MARLHGDHANALAWLIERSGHVDVSESTQPFQPRVAYSLSQQQMNVVFFAYTCIHQGLTGPMYAALLRAAYGIGADIPESYTSSKTYGEITGVVGDVLFEETLSRVRASPVLCLCVDEGTRQELSEASSCVAACHIVLSVVCLVGR